MRISAVAAGFDVDGTRLVGPLTLDVEQGALLAVVGPNGAGKTTLLQLLAGDLRPTRGSVTYDLRDAAGVSVAELARLRSVLTQRPSEDVAFTTREVVEMGRYAFRDDPTAGSADHSTTIDEALEAVDLHGLEDRPVASLSGGERQRTGLARILAQNTPVVLLDEPTTSLDIGHQQLVMEIMANLADAGRTVVAVLHDLNLAAGFDDVLLLDRGTPAAHGPASEVLSSGRLSEAYGYPIEVVNHPLRPGPLILPRPQR